MAQAWGSVKKKYYFLYKTTNLVNSKYYIGLHSTDNLEDGYLGSGKLLKRAIEKYGRGSFTREILMFYESFEEAVAAEEDYVKATLLKDDLCYNLKLGGTGIRIPGYKHSKEIRQKISKELKGKTNSEEHNANISKAKRGIRRPEWAKRLKADYASGKRKSTLKPRYGPLSLTEESRQKLSARFSGKNNPNYGGKLQTGESRRKMSEAFRRRDFKLLWVSDVNNEVSTLVKDTVIEEYLNNGWIRGRKYHVNRNSTGKFI